MYADVLKRRDSLFARLEKEFAGTCVEIKPRSPKKYVKEEDACINVWCEHEGEHRIVLGMQIQQKLGPYKLWFVTHPEWETITQYPVKVWAQNSKGLGNGDGFYLFSENEIVDEIRAYLMQYYGIQ